MLGIQELIIFAVKGGGGGVRMVRIIRVIIRYLPEACWVSGTETLTFRLVHWHCLQLSCPENETAVDWESN